jgi:hypothetical protein
MVFSTVAQGNAFFINIVAITTADLLDVNGSTTSVTGPAGWQSGGGAAAGQVVLRDLGKTVRIPATNAYGSYQRMLRKVQKVDTPALTSSAFPVTNGFVGFNEGVGGSADAGSGTNPSGFETFYIEIGTDGQNPSPKFVRLGF